MKIELTKVSSKGQIVIPQAIRKSVGLHDGETLTVSAQDGIIVLKKIDNTIDESDLRTLMEIKEAWKEIAEGKYKKMGSGDFLREISTW